MAYPNNKPSGNYALREDNFAELDTNKIPMDSNLWKNGYKNADESEVESVPDAHEQNWLFDVLHRNLKYTQDTAEENKRLLESKVASYTNIGQVKIGSGLNITSNGVLSVIRSVAEDATVISYDLPVGSYMLWAGKGVPDYFLEPDGNSLKRSEYPELWQFAQDNGLVGSLFGSGDGTTTFTITDIRGNFISIANSNDKVGKFTEAGLPDHYHTTTMRRTKKSGLDTATVWSYSENTRGDGTVDTNLASVSNSIYGKSSTVTPANWGLKLIIKAKPTPPSKVVPTGTILSYTMNTDNFKLPGYIVANGAELMRSEYSDLFNWASANKLIVSQSQIPTTAHAYYGDGDGKTTFTIPDLRGVFMRNADLSSNRGGATPCTYQADGLPNITGQFDMFSGRAAIIANSATGAFSSATSIGAGSHSDYSKGHKNVYFNASKSNAIYGNSDYVQPKSVSIIPILKY